MDNNKYTFNIEWYGHCCFRITYKNIRFLIDPYDTFENIDCGMIDSDYLLSSSTWHDHGHIGASPKSVIVTYPGNYDFEKDFKLYGIKTEESRGTPNTIFSVRFDDGFCFTNFADWGDEKGFEKLKQKEKQLLANTLVAFTRLNWINQDKDFYCYDLALKTCTPNIIVPEHFYPLTFIQKNVPVGLQADYVKKIKQIDYMRDKTRFTSFAIKGYQSDIAFDKNNKLFLDFSEVSSQVKYR